ncbi:7-cyano-7-deazaguanine synthase [Methylobacterium sp. Leaf465]|uniref:7-cyano-7-deazaguanine synthase n=1 Tax=Methylobacterium sp. Leaf465 TaxID=1736385 RepID=UPI00070096EA|nr:7-cyano-7-deazaguanine synthase [Methylobacterium sp. Leaf465]KQT70260.1 7-cyano-7-deazaguanine synthase [Methylobacterium sp. Leaf465]
MRVLLFSGGLDSTALAWWQKPDVGFFVDYGQAAAVGEHAAAVSIASELGLRLETLKVDLSGLGLGPLAGKPPSELGRGPEWWPYRNQMLLTLAGMRFVGEGLTELLIGSVATDVHADGRPPFLRAMDRVMAVQEGGVRVKAPARCLDGPALLETSGIPERILGATFSCHVMEYACGRCPGCNKHRETLRRFREGKHGGDVSKRRAEAPYEPERA